MIADMLGRPIVLRLAPTQHADIRTAPELIAEAGPFRRLLADRGYDADPFHDRWRDPGATAVSPGRSNRNRPIRLNKRLYARRRRIEATFCRLEDFRHVATRYDEFAANLLSAVTLAVIYAF